MNPLAAPLTGDGSDYGDFYASVIAETQQAKNEMRKMGESLANTLDDVSRKSQDTIAYWKRRSERTHARNVARAVHNRG